MIAFGPFVPCVYEKQVLLRAVWFERVQHAFQQFLIQGRRASGHNEGIPALPRGVVPHGRDATVTFIAGTAGGAGEAFLDIPLVLEAIRRQIMPEILFPAPVDRTPEVAVFLQQWDNVMRRKLYGSIEALVFQI